MEETETIDPNYQKGFNDGYLLKKHLPGIADKLAETEGNSTRLNGFRDGREEFILEQKRDKYPAWRKSEPSHRFDDAPKSAKLKELEKDIEDPEPEV